VSLTTSEKEANFSKHVFELQAWINTTLPTLDPTTVIEKLLTVLPDIAIDKDEDFVRTCQAWLIEQSHAIEFKLDPAVALDYKREVFSKNYSDWHNHLGIKWRFEDHANIIIRLMARLDECPSPPETGFCACAECYENCVYNWCIDTLDEICWKRAVYQANMKMPLGQAMKLKPHRKNEKPMVYEIHGNLLVVQVSYPAAAAEKRRPVPEDQNLLWILPADWLEWAQVLWPVHAKWAKRVGWYLVKRTQRQLRNGVWLPCDVSAHGLFMASDARQHIEAADRNYLRWHDNNLRLIEGTEVDCTDPDVPPSGVCQLNTDVANLDDYRPAKATRVRNAEGKGHATPSELSASWGLDRVIAKADGTSILSPRSKEGLNKFARGSAGKAERQLIHDLGAHQ